MPISDFWKAEDLIPISQTKVSIPSENGLSFNEGQEINISIPPSVQFIQPKQCYLSWDVQLGLPTSVTGASMDGKRTRLMLDEVIGSQVLIRDISIRSGGAGGALLEQYQNYNQYVHMKYDYETNDNIKNKRALTEGSLAHSVRNRGTVGTTTSDKNDTFSNPWFKPRLSEAALDQTDLFNSAGNFIEGEAGSDLTTARCCIPLQTGLFQTDKVLPILLTEGLHVTIQLENQVNVFRQLDTVLKQNRLMANPVFYGATNAGAAPSGTGMTECFVGVANNITSLQNFPFVIGEEIMFVGEDGVTCKPPTSDRRGIISDIEMAASAAGTQLVKLTLTDAVAQGGGAAQGASFDLAGGLVAPQSGTHYLYSTTCSRQDSILAGEALTATGAEYVPRYQVRNVNLILQQLEMPRQYVQKMESMMREGGSMRYDFVSSQNFKYSQLQGDVVANIRLPINYSKMKSVCSVPTDSTIYNKGNAIAGYGTYLIDTDPNDIANYSDQSGLVGVWDELQDYQLFYGGKLNPSRKVACGKISARNSIDQQPLIELEKSLAMSGIVPYSFRAFQRNAIIGRAVSLHDGVYNAQGKDFNLQVEYTGTAPDKNKLWMNWVCHIKTIVFTGDGISVDQ